MFKSFNVLALSCVLAFGAIADNRAPPIATEEQKPKKDWAKEILTDAAVVALIIAASVSAYKATGRPCACPSDTMRNGHACGGRSAWSRLGGFKPLCFPSDVSAAMISAYRATKSIPALR